MPFTTKSKENNINEGWKMGFFFIFFQENDNNTNNNNNCSTIFNSKNKKRSNFSLITSLKSINTHLLSITQTTISICVFLIFTTFLFFTLSNFEPPTHPTYTSRKQLYSTSSFSSTSQKQHALQGMGLLYSRGTRAMSELTIAHVIESVNEKELKLFLKHFLRSKLSSKSDLLFIFPSKSKSFERAIYEETNTFLKMLTNGSYQGFDPTHFKISMKKANESSEPIWGKKIQSKFSGGDSTESTRSSYRGKTRKLGSGENSIWVLKNERKFDGDSTESTRTSFEIVKEEKGSEGKNLSGPESTRLSYGSVIGFTADELDPENSLSGFLDHVPMRLRRWACYQMLLGRVRRNFKHIVIVDVKEILLLGDPLSRVKNPSQDSVVVSSVAQRRKKLEKNLVDGNKQASPSLIMGGAKGVRRFSSKMLIEIVREAMERKRKNSVSELVLLNRLVGNEVMLKNVDLVLGEPIVEASSLNELDAQKLSVVRRGNSIVDI